MTRTLLALAAGGLAVLAGCTLGPARDGGGGQRWLAPHDPALRFGADLRSWQELHRENVVMQQYDYSCGAAALATIFRYYFRDDVTEVQVLDTIMRKLSRADVEERTKNGLSLDDLFEASRDLGYQAAAVRIPAAKLRDLPAPVLVRIVEDDYRHFVVLRGVVEDRAILADPTRGNLRVPMKTFLKQWGGEALVLGKRGFGLPKDHPLSVKKIETPLRNEELAARRALYRSP